MQLSTEYSRMTTAQPLCVLYQMLINTLRISPTRISLLQHICCFVFSMVTPEKDLGFASSRQWEWPDITTTFSAFRHCSLTLSLMHNMMQPSDHPVYWFRYVSQSPKIHKEYQMHCQNVKQEYLSSLICWLWFHYIYSWPLLLEGCTTHSFLADYTVGPPGSFPQSSVLSLSCRGPSHAKSRTLHLSVLKFNLLQSNSPPQQDAH